ncbi:hypothetical protein NPIL_663001 [Nephila pilipes]|uniref:Uncharacterized protein n=1 Tax=Nephila pilipes TaxID=299642 RepID=A0A8X6UNP0_NEPPI|nr:hypothetical protein NPIL_663001 [Nephila pilipes]
MRKDKSSSNGTCKANTISLHHVSNNEIESSDKEEHIFSILSRFSSIQYDNNKFYNSNIACNVLFSIISQTQTNQLYSFQIQCVALFLERTYHHILGVSSIFPSYENYRIDNYRTVGRKVRKKMIGTTSLF